MDLQRTRPHPAWTPSGRAVPGPLAFHGAPWEPPPPPTHRQAAAGMCELPSTKNDFGTPGFSVRISGFRVGVLGLHMSAPRSLPHFPWAGLYGRFGRRGPFYVSAFPLRARDRHENAQTRFCPPAQTRFCPPVRFSLARVLVPRSFFGICDVFGRTRLARAHQERKDSYRYCSKETEDSYPGNGGFVPVLQ